MVTPIDFDRFMTSESTKSSSLAFTSKTRQSVEHTRHRIFSFGVFCQREDKLRHFIGSFSDSRLEEYS